VAASPRDKNTPPLSPRTLSNDGIENANAIKLANPSASANGLQEDNGTIPMANISNVTNPSAPVKPPRGKLTVRIPEARGIRPSYYPYAVCVFEWNESIARGTKGEDEEVDKDSDRGKEYILAGAPVKRSVSDMGRSMAIPMKSRQGSTTSLSDQKKFKMSRQLTDPKWEHEAELCAHPLV
jgi:serine/threonine protein kinase SCH9